jgi:hypothetical protein
VATLAEHLADFDEMRAGMRMRAIGIVFREADPPLALFPS